MSETVKSVVPCSLCGRQESAAFVLYEGGAKCCHECMGIAGQVHEQVTARINAAQEAKPKPWPLGSAHYTAFFEMPDSLTWQR